MKDGFIKVAVAAPLLRVADCVYNGQQSLSCIRRAAAQGVKLLVLPELGLTGYTCGDLFLQPALLSGAEAALLQLLEETAVLELVFVVGLPVAVKGRLYNCAAVCQKGRILGIVPKSHLPNYGEYSESRWFAKKTAGVETITICGRSVPFGTEQMFVCRNLPQCAVGVEVCEDLWAPDAPSRLLAEAGVTILCNPAASSDFAGKARQRRDLVKSQSARLTAAYLFVSCGEGESTSDCVFSGHGIIAENNEILAEQRFSSDLLITEVDVDLLEGERRRRQNLHPAEGIAVTEFEWTPEETDLTRTWAENPFAPKEESALHESCREMFRLAALGLKSRMLHTGAKTAVIGLSGGLDSTLALLIILEAFDLMGKDRKDILAVTMPCFGTTNRTKSNAELLAQQAGCTFRTIAIGDTVKSHFSDIGQPLDNHDVTFENGQARERTQVLMDLANMCGGLVIGTGDLSELALGWATYNGDHMSMYSVNSSIPKTMVRHMVRDAAAYTSDKAMARVLTDILDTPVSPELLPATDGNIAQKTEDLVGPYDLHDFFLYYIVLRGFAPGKVLRLAQRTLGDRFDRETIRKWLRTFYGRFFAQQFKRNCLPDGPKVSEVSFSPRGEWKMPADAVSSLWQKELERL